MESSSYVSTAPGNHVVGYVAGRVPAAPVLGDFADIAFHGRSIPPFFHDICNAVSFLESDVPVDGHQSFPVIDPYQAASPSSSGNDTSKNAARIAYSLLEEHIRELEVMCKSYENQADLFDSSGLDNVDPSPAI
jgi:hypothetical protein